MARSAEVWMDAMAAVGRPVTTAKVCVAAATTAKVCAATVAGDGNDVERAEEHVAAAAASGGVGNDGGCGGSSSGDVRGDSDKGSGGVRGVCVSAASASCQLTCRVSNATEYASLVVVGRPACVFVCHVCI